VIIITVASYNGAPLAQPLAAQFDELGGNIGRADNNQLVLPDPERSISRVHAQVVFRGGRYAIVDRGSNPISVNGRPLGNGQEAPLQSGDQIQIGGYLMHIEAGAGGAAAAAADPFADFAGLAAPAPMSAGRAAPASAASLDPLAGFGLTPSAAPPPFGGGGGGGFGGGGGGFGAPPAAAPSAGGIPADWDPFAPDPQPSGGQDFARSLGQRAPAANLGLEVGGRAAAPLIPDLPGQGSTASDSLDNLFGLGAPASSGADPLANSVFGQAAALPNMAAHADPLKSLNSLTRAGSSAAADAGSELNSPFMPTPMAAPAARNAPPPAARPALPLPPPRAEPAAPGLKGAVLSWDAPSGDSQTVIRPRGAPPAPRMPPGATAPLGGLPDDALFDLSLGPLGAPAAPAAARPTVPPPQVVPPTQQPRAAAMPAAPAAAPRSAAAPSDQAALISALREGLGMSTLPIDSLTPEFMKLLGQLVHESARGTVELLVARAALKREVRAEITMIVARENNPLKFSPTVEVALGHLLSPPARGFLPPDRAMRDAYDDLRAHQFAFLAGMRAALEGVLKRFDPAVLEGKLTQKSVLSSLLPGARKARMWDVFTELYGQISAEAADDFHELFGKEFLRAYEAHIDQLASGRER